MGQFNTHMLEMEISLNYDISTSETNIKNIILGDAKQLHEQDGGKVERWKI